MDGEFIRELFAEFGPVQVRRMFSGAGIYADGVMFALATGGVVYLKADDESIAAFEREKCKPFEYRRKEGRRAIMSYWSLPARLYDDPEELACWARVALATAHKAARRKTKKKRG